MYTNTAVGSSVEYTKYICSSSGGIWRLVTVLLSNIFETINSLGVVVVRIYTYKLWSNCAADLHGDYLFDILYLLLVGLYT